MDTVDQTTRSKIMASVGQKNTGPEMALRSTLHRRGLRYRLHDRNLPGSPDLVFPRFKAVIFVHGCYWHAHDCYRGTKPKSRQRFWDEKFQANQHRDARNVERLVARGWRVLTVWECAIKGKTAKPSDMLAQKIDVWLKGKRTIGTIDGKDSPRQKVVEHLGKATIARDRHRDGHSGKVAS